jgi:hypothetical protein
MPKKDVSLEEFRSTQMDEWNTYVAAGPIDIGTARAFNAGDAVPASHVLRGVVRQDQVIHREDISANVELPGVVTVRRPIGAVEMASPEDIAAAEAANRAAGVID